MKSIGARLTIWYALAATTTLAILFVAGYYLLETHLIHGLDLLNASEFKEIQARLGPDYKTLSPAVIDERIRETTDYSSVLFFIDIHDPQRTRLFLSTNLGGRNLPDVPGERVFNGEMPEIGEVRVGEFLLPPFEVMIATSLDQVRMVMEGYVRVCLALLVGMLVASVALGFVLSRLMLRPLRLIRQTASRIGSENLSERIPVDDVKDEISELARLLNQMFDRLEASFDQIRRFTEEASHELKTPLSLVRLHAEKMLIKDDLPAVQKEAVHVQLEELARLNHIIDELLFLSRANAGAIKLDLQPQEPSPFLHNFAQDAAVLAEHHGRHFTYSHEGDGTIAFEAKWMRQVLLNLLTNALNVSPPGGTVTLRSTLAESMWSISVEDEGPGLSEEQRVRMFERFVRFDTPGKQYKGSGLGLAICRSLVELHGGRIFAVPAVSHQGLRVAIELPAQNG